MTCASSNSDQSSLPHPIDLYVGQRLKTARIVRNLVQEDLGRALNLTTQQIQKYEKGLNRISASKLYELSKALKVGVNYFFPHDNLTSIDSSSLLLDKLSENNLYSKDTAKLLALFQKIENKKIRERIIDLVAAIPENSCKDDVE